LAGSDVDTIGNYQQFPSYALQGRACHALFSAMTQEPFPCIGGATLLMPSLDTAIGE
jgi:hypothetical protein